MLGEEISRIIQEQRTLEIRYEELIHQVCACACARARARHGEPSTIGSYASHLRTGRSKGAVISWMSCVGRLKDKQLGPDAGGGVEIDFDTTQTHVRALTHTQYTHTHTHTHTAPEHEGIFQPY